MLLLIRKSANRIFSRCVCCGGVIRHSERYLQVVNVGNGIKNVKGECYCQYCQKEAIENNPGVLFGVEGFKGQLFTMHRGKPKAVKVDF